MSFHLRGHRTKSRKKYRIEQNAILVYTKPERQTTLILRELGYDPMPNETIPVYDEDEKKWYNLQIDNLLKLFEGKFGLTAIHTDGHDHERKGVERHDKWKDKLLVKHEVRSIHLPTERLANEELRETARKDLKVAIESSEKVIYLAP